MTVFLLLLCTLLLYKLASIFSLYHCITFLFFPFFILQAFFLLSSSLSLPRSMFISHTSSFSNYLFSSLLRLVLPSAAYFNLSSPSLLLVLCLSPTQHPLQIIFFLLLILLSFLPPLIFSSHFPLFPSFYVYLPSSILFKLSFSLLRLVLPSSAYFNLSAPSPLFVLCLSPTQHPFQIIFFLPSALPSSPNLNLSSPPLLLVLCLSPTQHPFQIIFFFLSFCPSFLPLS